MKSATKFFGSIFGIGFSPFFPGTLGSLFACLVFIFFEPFHHPVLLSIFTFLLLIAGIWLGNLAEQFDEKDPCWFIVDEWVGQNIPLIILASTDYYFILLSFVMFRIFDISKILKINNLQKYHGGTGIMLDDVLAGIYSLLIVGGVKWLLI